jgi:hypothetical protein
VFMITSHEAAPGAALDEWCLEVFGADRLAADIGNEADVDDAQAFLLATSNACNEAGGIDFVGERRRFFDDDPEDPVMVFSNPANVGLAPYISARMYNTHRETERHGLFGLRRREIREDVAVSLQGLALVIREVRICNKIIGAAVKRATKQEVASAIATLDKLTQTEESSHLPRVSQFVELAPGLDPVVKTGARSFRRSVWVGIDSAHGNYEVGDGRPYSRAVQEETARLAGQVQAERPDEYIGFILGDGQKLPLDSLSAREVFARNVFNAVDIDSEVKRGMFAEAHRVLQPHGLLIVKVDWHQGAYPPNDMVQLLKDNRFAALSIIESTHPNYKWLQQEYGTPEAVEAPPGGYYVMAHPLGHFFRRENATF